MEDIPHTLERLGFYELEPSIAAPVQVPEWSFIEVDLAKVDPSNQTAPYTRVLNRDGRGWQLDQLLDDTNRMPLKECGIKDETENFLRNTFMLLAFQLTSSTALH